MGDLGLNQHHQDQLLAFLKHCRAERSQRLRAIDACFEETEKSRLNDSTFTKDEVKDLLYSLLTTVRADIESELLNSAHTTLLLVRQLCGQAEQWKLNLIIDMSELQNRELLDAMLVFEEQHVSDNRKASNSNASLRKSDKISILRRLEPINYTEEHEKLTGAKNQTLNDEIDRLRRENVKMKKEIEKKEKSDSSSSSRTTTAGNEITTSGAEEIKITKEHQKLTEKLQAAQQKDNNDEEIRKLQKKLDETTLKLNKSSQEQREIKEKMEEELTSVQTRLLEMKAHLELTEAELDKKFSKTNAYKNMKQILSGKNQQIKKMRDKLKKYEPETTQDDED